MDAVQATVCAKKEKRRKIMKKIFALILVVILAASLLTACGSFTCDFCGRTVSGSKNTVKYDGDTYEYCDSDVCEDAAEAFEELEELRIAFEDLEF